MLTIPDKILTKMIAICDYTKDELSALLRVVDNKVVDIAVLDQLSQYTYTEMDGDVVARHTMDQFLKGVNPAEWCALFHGHPIGMSSNPSSTDDEMLIKQCGEKHGYSVILSSPEKSPDGLLELDITYSYVVRTQHGVLTSSNMPVAVEFTGDRKSVYDLLIKNGVDQSVAMGSALSMLRTGDDLLPLIQEVNEQIESCNIRKGFAGDGYTNWYSSPDETGFGLLPELKNTYQSETYAEIKFSDISVDDWVELDLSESIIEGEVVSVTDSCVMVKDFYDNSIRTVNKNEINKVIAY